MEESCCSGGWEGIEGVGCWHSRDRKVRGGQLKAWELQETAQDIIGYTHTHTHTLQAVAAPTQWAILPSLLTLAAAALEA